MIESGEGFFEFLRAVAEMQEHYGLPLVDMSVDAVLDAVSPADKERLLEILNPEDDGHDGQPTLYEEYQDVFGGDDWDHGQFD